MTVEEIRRVREEKGYSLSHLAQLSGVPLGTLQKLMNGTTKRPRYQTLQALEKALKKDTGDGSVYTYAGQTAEGSSMLLYEPSAAAAYQNEGPRKQKESGEENWGEVSGRGADWRILLSDKKQGEYTIEDYYRIPDEQRVELIDGIIYDLSAPSLNHQAVIGSIFGQLREKIRSQGGPCLPFLSPVDVKLGTDNRTMVQPDVIILCDPDQRRRWGIEGAPDFLLEVLSPSTSHKDMVTKFRKYRDSGVREYWLLDPEEKILFMYDFRNPSDVKCKISPLAGQAALAIYDGEITVDLDEVAAQIADDLPE